MQQKKKEEDKTRHDRVEKMIPWELCIRLKFDHTIKWYMYKPESILENETHKILWNFYIKMDHFIQALRQDLVLINQKKDLVIL